MISFQRYLILFFIYKREKKMIFCLNKILHSRNIMMSDKSGVKIVGSVSCFKVNDPVISRFAVLMG